MWQSNKMIGAVLAGVTAAAVTFFFLARAEFVKKLIDRTDSSATKQILLVYLVTLVTGLAVGGLVLYVLLAFP